MTFLPRHHHLLPTSTTPPPRSTRLAEKEPAVFVPVASKEIQLKALRESLASCSAALKKQVTGRKLIKRKKPLGALDLGRLAKATGVSYSGHQAVAVVERESTATP